MEENGQPKKAGLSRNALVLGLVSFFTDVSSEMTVKTLPLFLSNVLGVKAEVIGLIEGVADTTATILKMFSGWFSDKVGKRKPLVAMGYTLSAIAKPLLYLANTWPLVLILRFVERVGKGVRSSPKDALIADSTDKNSQGRAFGFNRSMDTLGSMVGLIIAALVVGFGYKGLVALTRGTFQTLVLVAIIPAAMSIMLVFGFVKDTGAGRRPATAPRLSPKGFDSRFWTFLGIMVVFTLGNSSDAFLILRAQKLGLSIVEIFIMLAMFNFVASALSVPAGILSDRIGRHRVILIGWLVYGLVYLGFAFAHVGWQVWGLYTIYGLYYGATDGVARALVADVVPADKRGTAYGLFNFAVGITALPASVIAGVLWDKVDSSAPFLFGAVLALAAMVAMALLIRPRKEAQA